MITFFTNLSLFLYKDFCITNTHFSPLSEMLYGGRVKLFAEVSELFAPATFQLIISPQNCVFVV